MLRAAGRGPSEAGWQGRGRWKAWPEGPAIGASKSESPPGDGKVRGAQGGSTRTSKVNLKPEAARGRFFAQLSTRAGTRAGAVDAGSSGALSPQRCVRVKTSEARGLFRPEGDGLGLHEEKRNRLLPLVSRDPTPSPPTRDSSHTSLTRKAATPGTSPPS